MKKAFQAIFSVVIMLALVMSVVASTPVSAASTSKKDEVYKFLTGELGFNSAAASGIMANIERESDFDPTEVIIDSNGLLSGGLCQWNGSRFSSLKNFCNRNGYNYLSVKGQLKYLEHELSQNYYKHIYDYLKDVPNTAQGAYQAAYYWCYYFEIPANRSRSAVTRGNTAKKTYWPKYGNTKLAKIDLECNKENKTVDINGTVKFSWNSAGSNVRSYTLVIATKKNGSYNWDKAKKISLSASKKSYSYEVTKEGSFAAYIIARSVNDSVKSEKIKFSAQCLKHDYEVKVIREATSSQTGIKKYSCSKCNHSYEKSVSKVNIEKAVNIKSAKIKKATATTLTVSWSKNIEASGYEIYLYNGSKQIKKEKISKAKNSYKFKKLSSGETYKIKIRAYAKKNGKTVYSSFITLEAATKPETVNISKISRPAYKTIVLGWDKVKGADGYVIYMSTTADGKYKKVATAKKNATSCELNNLQSGKYYYFKIKAYTKAQDNTAYSTESNIKFAKAL